MNSPFALLADSDADVLEEAFAFLDDWESSASTTSSSDASSTSPLLQSIRRALQ